MRTVIFLWLIASHLDCFAQDWMSSLSQYATPKTTERQLNCWVHNSYAKGLQKESVQTAQYFSDLLPHYPESWLERYRSTQLIVTKGEQITKAKGKSNVLTSAQIDLLKGVELNNKIQILIEYTQTNVITKAVENRTMDISFVIVPDQEAVFTEGELLDYLKDQIAKEIASKQFNQFEQFAAKFTVAENGTVEAVKTLETSKNKAIDQLIIKIIQNMPKWKPAQNNDGKKVKQEFELYTGYWMRGC